MSSSAPLEVAPTAYAGLIGVARRDTTPPEGIYCAHVGRRDARLRRGCPPTA